MTLVRQKSYCYSSGDSSSSREKSLVLFSPDATRGSIKSKGKIRKSRAQQTETDEEESSEQDHSPVDLPEQAHGSPIKNCGSYCSFQSPDFEKSIETSNNKRFPSRSGKRGGDGSRNCLLSCDQSNSLALDLSTTKSHSKSGKTRTLFSQESPQQFVIDDDEEKSLAQNVSSFVALAQTISSPIESPRPYRHFNSTGFQKSKDNNNNKRQSSRSSKYDADRRHVRSSPCAHSPKTHDRANTQHEMRKSKARFSKMAIDEVEERSTQNDSPLVVHTNCNAVEHSGSFRRTQSSGCYTKKENHCFQSSGRKINTVNLTNDKLPSKSSKRGADNRCTRFTSSEKSKPLIKTLARTKSQSKMDAWKVLFSPETPQQQLVNDEEDSTTQEAQTNHNSQIESSRSKIGRQTRSCEQPSPVTNTLGNTKSQSKTQKSRVMSPPESPQQQIVNDEEESPTQDPSPVAPLVKSNKSQIESSRSHSGRRTRFTSSKNSRPFTTAVGSTKSQSKMDAWKVLFSPETPQQQLVNDEQDSTTQDTSPAVLRAQTNHSSQIESSRSKIRRQTRFTSCEQHNPVPNTPGNTKSQSKTQKSRVMSSPKSPQQQIVNDEEESPTQDPTPVAPLAKSNNSQIESRSKNGRRSLFTSSKNSRPFTTAVGSTKSQSKMDAWKVLFSPETPQQQLVNDEEDSTTQDTSPAVLRAQTNHSRIESSRSNNSRRTRFTCCEQPNPVPKTLGSTTSKSRIPKSRVPESPQQHLVNNEEDSTEQDPSPVAPLAQTNNSQIENSCSKSPTFEKWEETVAKRTSSRSGENNTENKCSSDKAQSSPIRTLAESMGRLSISHVQNFPTSQSPIPSNDSSPIYAGSPDSSSCESLAEVSTTDNIENNYSITPTNLLRNGKSNQVSYAELSKKTSSGTRHSGHPLQQLNHNIGLKKGATFYYQPLQTEIRCQKVESPSSFPDPLKRFPKSTRSRLITIHKRIVSLHRQEPRSSIVFSLTKDQIIFLTLKILLNKGPLETSNSNSPTDRIFGHTLVVVRDKSWIDPYCQALREGSSLSVLDHPSLLLRERKSTSNTERFSKYGVVLTTFDVLKSTETTLPLNETGEFILPAAASSSTQGQWYSSRNGSQPVASPPLAQCSVLHRILWTRVILVDAIGRKSYLAKPDTSRFIASKNLCSNGRLLFFPCPDEEDNQHRDAGLNRLLKSDKRAHVAIGSLLRLPEPQHNEGNLRDNAIDAEDIY